MDAESGLQADPGVGTTLVVDRACFNDLLRLCDEAALAINTYHADESRAGLLRSKSDKSPLTQADLAANDIVCSGLRRLTPDVPILSEESPAAEVTDRLEWPQLWMLDPLDGTREFLERTGEFTINLALIDRHRPSFGIIYQPQQRCAYLGMPGRGAWRVTGIEHGSGCFEPVTTRRLSDETLVLLASRRHRNDKLATAIEFLESQRRVSRANSGSAIKFCDLATGVGDCYPRFSPCSEWDVAAGDALVTAAGGRVVGMDAGPLRYNARDTLLSPHFLAMGDPGARLWDQLLALLP